MKYDKLHDAFTSNTHLTERSDVTHPKPIMKPPNALHNEPMNVTPPFVPGGTVFPVVIKMG